MLLPDAELPAVARVPAPWQLRGNAWIVAMRWPRGARADARTQFILPELRPTLAGPLSLLMMVDYASAPCGPYRELLFVPGSLRFTACERHLSISRILVSTWDSVVNGRANWGIPKDRADFVVDRALTDRISVVAESGTSICTLEFAQPRGPRLPLRTHWLPQRWLTLAQRYESSTYYYTPVARGTAQFCRLIKWRFDNQFFPDLAAAQVLASVRVTEFEMTFPVAQVVDLIS